MNFELKTASLDEMDNPAFDALIVVTDGAATAAGGPLSALVRTLRSEGELADKAGKWVSMYRPAGLKVRRLVAVSCGQGSAQDVNKAVSAAVGSVKGNAQVKTLGIAFAFAATGVQVRAAVQASAGASYTFTTTKSKPEGRKIKAVMVGLPDADVARPLFDRAVAGVQGVELAKEWANRPANHATPTHLAQAAKAIAKSPVVTCEVLGPKQVAKLGMGSFMAVAQASSEELRFIVLNYKGGARTEAPVVLIGKGITFDTGGISLKPAPEMDEMKYDMCGAASVLGVFRALAELKPHINVVGLIPTCENMPGGKALKPGDVVTSMSGQTIEVLNTDAEGRLILCDALTYAERFKPRAVIDIATLTGACVIALGHVRSGLFSSSDALASQLLAAGDSALDTCWRMPLDDDYAEGLKSNFADVANVAGRDGGSVTAAKFLQRFAGKFEWAHLDIAGTAWKSGAAKGATGRPVGLLLDYLLDHAAVSPTSEKTALRAVTRVAASKKSLKPL